MINKKIKKVFKSLDPDVQEAIKFLINEIQVKREIKKLEKSEKKLKKALTLTHFIRKIK